MITRKINDAAIRAGKYAADLENRRMWFRASTNQLCPDRKVIEPSAWKRGMKQYMKNPIVLDSHRYDSVVDRTIGKAVAWEIDDTGLLLQVEFAETEVGRAAWYLYSNGYANAGSVGWDTLESEPAKSDDDVEYERITKAQLLEFSGCCVGADSEALSKHADPMAEVAVRLFAPDGPDKAKAEGGEAETDENAPPCAPNEPTEALLEQIGELRAVGQALLIELYCLRDDIKPLRTDKSPASETAKPEPDWVQELRKTAKCVTLTDEELVAKLRANLQTE